MKATYDVVQAIQVVETELKDELRRGEFSRLVTDVVVV